jgi:hypothetical protein
MIEDKQLETLLGLPPDERLKLARILIESVAGEAADQGLAETADQKVGRSNTLLSLAGRYDGGPGNTSDVDETILETEVDTVSGLSVR